MRSLLIYIFLFSFSVGYSQSIPKLVQLEKAVGAGYIPYTDAGGVQVYNQLSPDLVFGTTSPVVAGSYVLSYAQATDTWTYRTDVTGAYQGVSVFNNQYVLGDGSRSPNPVPFQGNRYIDLQAFNLGFDSNGSTGADYLLHMRGGQRTVGIGVEGASSARLTVAGGTKIGGLFYNNHATRPSFMAQQSGIGYAAEYSNLSGGAKLAKFESSGATDVVGESSVFINKLNQRTNDGRDVLLSFNSGSNGTTLPGFGTIVNFNGQSNAGNTAQIGNILAFWDDPADGSEKGRVRIEANGSGGLNSTEQHLDVIGADSELPAYIQTHLTAGHSKAVHVKGAFRMLDFDNTNDFSGAFAASAYLYLDDKGYVIPGAISNTLSLARATVTTGTNFDTKPLISEIDPVNDLVYFEDNSDGGTRKKASLKELVEAATLYHVAGVVTFNSTTDQWDLLLTSNHAAENIATVTSTAGTNGFTVNFPNNLGDVIYGVAIADDQGSEDTFVAGTSVGVNSMVVTVNTTSSINGYIRYTAGNWSDQSLNSGVTNITGFLWTTNELTITHDEIFGAQSGRHVTAFDTYLIPVISSFSATETKVKFLNPATNSFLTTESTDMKFLISANGSTKPTNSQLGALNNTNRQFFINAYFNGSYGN